MEQSEIRECVKRSAQAVGVVLTDEHAYCFYKYLEHLTLWNKAINLTAIEDSKEIIVKHFTDSLTALVSVSIQHGAVLIDIGTGAGFPSIPLKIVRPDLTCELIEPNRKKVSFLTSIIGSLKLSNVSVFVGNIEDYIANPDHKLGDIVVFRALKFEPIVKHVSSILHKSGLVILYRTERLKRASTGSLSVEAETSFSLPFGYGERVISVLRHQDSVPRGTSIMEKD
ncbi:16S rRNA (guanine(527)-N(7))-methyltransferase RsmG [Nitrospira sp. KM1]|uniref:16S rRNA (guanine(527)-N(7))-methyltransferase RsmG n=1 Tax=Nitrospira sp. KM1 TaxID=1936990 RepID=UPI001564AFFF|nr:16S rRNA (guanine(527)-N(7))-methyltransferase RsmG [Nitrospira sp. KM1]